MKNPNYRATAIFFILIMTGFTIGCTGEPVRVELPVNHPANPQSEEAAFIHPPNPFQNNIPATGHQGESNSSMSHDGNQSMQPHQIHQMSPEMGKMSEGAESSHATEKQNPEHQHKENHQ